MDSIVLASKSPRRMEILDKLNLPYIVKGVEVDERIRNGRFVKSRVIDISRQKVNAASNDFLNGLILGIDTVVYFNHRVFGKPNNYDQAFRYIRMLSGNRHHVLSGITVKNVQTGANYSSYSVTDVYIIKLAEEEIRRYLEKGEWLDKAGGYAIQGFFALYIKKIVGSYYNVMGLPVEELFKLLKKFSYFESDGKYQPTRKI